MGGPYDFPWPRGGCHHDQTGMLAPAVGRTSPPHPLLAMSPCASSEALTIAHLFSTRDIAETFAAVAEPEVLANLCGVSQALGDTFCEPQLWAQQLTWRFGVEKMIAKNIPDPRREFSFFHASPSDAVVRRIHSFNSAALT